MAIPLVYNSCLQDDALEAAVADYQDVTARKEALDKERAEYEEQLSARKEQAAANGETLEDEERTWEEIDYTPFKTNEEKFVICLDTLGQDRGFTDEEKRFALNTVKRFREIWEKEEIDSLTADRDRKLALLGVDATVEAENL
jgi:hypothetical protein